jgi:hypothetical protein
MLLVWLRLSAAQRNERFGGTYSVQAKRHFEGHGCQVHNPPYPLVWVACLYGASPVYLFACVRCAGAPISHAHLGYWPVHATYC